MFILWKKIRTIIPNLKQKRISAKAYEKSKYKEIDFNEEDCKE